MPAPEELFGAWRLVAYLDRASEDEDWHSPLGDGATGLMSLQMPDVVSVHIYAPHPLDADTPTYVGYFGTFTVVDLVHETRRIHGALRFALEGAHPAALLDSDDDRPFTVEGDVLTLGDQRTWLRKAQRV